ncbi:MAG: hypothetical protein MK188_07365 [Gammaproteobacteria bacterium]|nr:hypothetical protein [Gammaproteobacteria bacterium]
MKNSKNVAKNNRIFALQLMMMVAASIIVFTISAPARAQLVGTVGIGDIDKKPNVSEEIHQLFVDEVSLGLVNTRKFRLMEHPVVEARLARQGLNLAGFYAKEYKSTELLQAGLDYILKAEILKAGVRGTCEGSVHDKLGEAQIRYTMYGVADETEDFTNVVKVQAHKHESSLANASDEDLVKGAIANAVSVLVRQVATKLFPIRVMKISEDGLVTLNYGSGLLDPGQTLVVYQGNEVSVINEFGVPQGETLGMLRVANTGEKFAQATTVEGFAGIEKGQPVMVLNANETATEIAFNNPENNACAPVIAGVARVVSGELSY